MLIATLALSLTLLTLPAAADEPVVVVTGEVAKPLKLTAADLARMPRQTVKATDHGGAEGEFEGVSLFEILKEAGVPLGADLRGPALATYLVVEAEDRYKAVFALPELDPAFTDRVVILADHRDGKKLPAAQGPFRVVVPGEKKQARWVRMVVTLRVVKA